MNRNRSWPAYVMMLFAFGAMSFELSHAAPHKSKSTTDIAAGWKKIGSETGNAESIGKMLEIKPSLAHWRLTLQTSVSEKAGASASSASVRVALMTCDHEKSSGKPGDWQQIEQLHSGKPGETITREFHNGLDKDGTGHWFAVQIVGQYTHYHLVAEQIDDNAATQPASTDPSDDTPTTKPTKKKKPK